MLPLAQANALATRLRTSASAVTSVKVRAMEPEGGDDDDDGDDGGDGGLLAVTVPSGLLVSVVPSSPAQQSEI